MGATSRQRQPLAPLASEKIAFINLFSALGLSSVSVALSVTLCKGS